MTPVSRPEMRAPGRAAAGTEVLNPPPIEGEAGLDPIAGGVCKVNGDIGGGDVRAVWAIAGVEGPDNDGEAASTTQTRWDLVATSLATVCARVEYGLTWKTGNESFPFSTPRSLNITEMK